MNVLYIIGNGLDIAHHMKTSYQDFFKHYLGQPSIDVDIQAMKKDIDKHKYETWADLEIGLGNYSSQCDNKDVFLKCLNDIKTNLKEYLQKESEKIALYRLHSYSGFVNPGFFLDPEPKNRYEMYRIGVESDLTIDIVTFNYTSTIESLLDFTGAQKRLLPTTSLRNILHIHGTLDNMMVMGVNDSSQISNTDINADLDVVEEFIKPEFNDACMNNKNIVCESLIQKADMIVLYGTSLGLSDEKWWKFIGQRMAHNNYPLLVYLPYDESKDLSKAPNHLRRWTMQCVREIREKFDIQLEESVLAQRICVAFNKRLFQIIKAPQPAVTTR